jgi:uncharacterized membrane protein YsdA (DUF1294 family)
MLTLFGLYLFGVNAVTFVAFASDKRRAVVGDRRVPEGVLLRLAALGGIAGALAAQRLFRHKTRKEPFRTWLRLIAVAHLALLIGVAAWARLAPDAFAAATGGLVGGRTIPVADGR